MRTLSTRSFDPDECPSRMADCCGLP
jgi:hypothetical protein